MPCGCLPPPPAPPPVCHLASRSHANNKTANRRYGRAKRGQRARGTVFFHRGTAFSALGVFSLLGMLDQHIIEGGYDADQFLFAFKTVVLPNLNPYPNLKASLSWTIAQGSTTSSRWSA